VPTVHHRVRCEMVGTLRFAHPTKPDHACVCALLRRSNRVYTGPNVYLWVVTFS